MPDEQLNEPDDVTEVTAHEVEPSTPPQYGVGPFSVREVALAGTWLVAFVISFFPVFNSLSISAWTGGGVSVWTAGLEWILTIGVPTAAVFLVVLRRLSPGGIRRVGSLGIDQFASVAFSVSAAVWIMWLWSDVARGLSGGFWIYSWVAWVELVLMLGGVALTVFAPIIPTLADDFAHRPEAAAHRSARPIRPVTARPAPALAAFQDDSGAEAAASSAFADYAPPADYASAADYAPAVEFAPAAPTAEGSAPEGDAGDEYGLAGDQDDWRPAHTRDTFAVFTLEPEPEPEPQQTPVRHQAFWALAPEERDVVDERGTPLFRIGPTAWALVIEDRGDLFVVRHEDGRIGYLRDIAGVTRG